MEFTYFQAILTGLIQGITELFPISSLGHAVLIPAWIGGSWSNFTTDSNSPYLAVTVALHAASAMALFLVFRKRWLELLGGALNSLRGKHNNASRVFWRVFLATIPVAILGFAFEKSLREVFASPLAASSFLTINGLLLFSAERLTRKSNMSHTNEDSNSQIVEHLSIPAAMTVGLAQSLALLSGISRFGVSMSAGLVRKLSHATASDFAFLLALPVIAGAAFLKLPDLFAPEYRSLLGPILAGSIVSFFATYASVTFLVKWFKTKTLYPFAFYCLLVGLISIVRFA
jgi:undecaprenyl-diphosphatase